MDLQKLAELQKELAKSVVLEDRIKLSEVKYVAGVDQSFIGKKKEKVISACIVLTFPELEVVKKHVEVEDVTFPYIPTFLMFREGDPAVKAVKKALNGVNDVVVLVDGSGIAHPRRCGLATYIALKLNVPTIGITKKKLFGRVELPQEAMESKPIYDNDEIIGYALKPCKNCNPIFISPGSFITPESALNIVKMCLRGYRLPEPIRLAHQLATKSKNMDLSSFFEF
jgi:deoxyribonuclease V